MSDSKEWVTIKIEEPTKKDAKDDPRTYTEIMQAGLNTDPTPSEMDFEDWWSPDYAQTIAHHVSDEFPDAVADVDRVGYEDVVNACKQAISEELDHR